MCTQLNFRSPWKWLGTIWIAKDAQFVHVTNQDSGQTGEMGWLSWVFSEHICKKVHFPTLQIIYYYPSSSMINNTDPGT